MEPNRPDPVIDEIREARRRLSERYGHDPRRLVAQYLETQGRACDRRREDPTAGDARGAWPRGEGLISSRQEAPMRYKVALLRSEEGYSVSVPGLPGCCSQGATEQEALANIAEAIREYLEVAATLAEEAEAREVEVAP